jgi:hypothetical protein
MADDNKARRLSGLPEDEIDKIERDAVQQQIANRRSVVERATIPVMIIMLSGLLMILVGMMYYVFIGPHPDASGSIQENPLNSLFWTDHPGIASIMLGLILWILGYIIDRRSRTGGSSS